MRHTLQFHRGQQTNTITKLAYDTAIIGLQKVLRTRQANNWCCVNFFGLFGCESVATRRDVANAANNTDFGDLLVIATHLLRVDTTMRFS